MNDNTRAARCQIPLLTNTLKVPCRQVGANSGSGWRMLPSPPLGLIISKKRPPFPSHQTKKGLSVSTPFRTKLLPVPFLFVFHGSVVHHYLCNRKDAFKISNLCVICDRPLQKLTGLVEEMIAGRNGLPRVGANGKSSSHPNKYKSMQKGAVGMGNSDS